MLPKDTINKLPLCEHRVTLQDRKGWGRRKVFSDSLQGKKNCQERSIFPNKG